MLIDGLIARRPSGRTGLAGWYTEVFEAQAAESLSAAELARRLNVTPTNIYYWRRRLRELDASEKGVDRTKGATGLVRVEMQPSPTQPMAGGGFSGFEVQLSNSRSIVVPPGFDPTELQRLVTTIESC